MMAVLIKTGIISGSLLPACCDLKTLRCSSRAVFSSDDCECGIMPVVFVYVPCAFSDVCMCG